MFSFDETHLPTSGDAGGAEASLSSHKQAWTAAANIKEHLHEQGPRLDGCERSQLDNSSREANEDPRQTSKKTQCGRLEAISAGLQPSEQLSSLQTAYLQSREDSTKIQTLSDMASLLAAERQRGLLRESHSFSKMASCLMATVKLACHPSMGPPVRLAGQKALEHSGKLLNFPALRGPT